MRPTTDPGWLLLIISTPGQQQALRMRMWRKLKALGTATLRDGVYLLPAVESCRALLDAQADEVIASGGTARVLEVPGPRGEFAAMFDRTPEYAAFVTAVKAAQRGTGTTQPSEAVRSLERFRQEFGRIAARDFFPGEARGQAEAALDAFGAAVYRRLSPDEPRTATGPIARLDIAAYQGRIWATRKHPWVDRLASAWLIHRYIDATARIRWIESPSDCPARAIGFDFDGARFTHVGGLVTCEVLAASFALQMTAGLERIQAIVHDLDVGGLPVPEAPGVETILRGMRDSCKGDDAFLAEAERMFDFLHAASPDPAG